MQAIDIHFHVVPPALVETLRAGAFDAVLGVAGIAPQERLVFRAPLGTPVEPETDLEAQSYDVALILAALDARETDIGALSPAPELFIDWAPPDTGCRFARICNDAMSELVATHPDRFAGLAMLPMSDPAAAVEELYRSVTDLGLRGVAICTHVAGRDLDDPMFEPVFAAASKLGVPVFLHPQNAGDTRRLADLHLWNTVGFPYETALAASRLVMGGVFDRVPGLNVILAHGGGYFPYQIGRLDHAYAARPDLRRRLRRKPSAYLHNIFCDSLVHDRLSLRFLIHRFGAKRIVLGCDFPFGMGTDSAVDSVRALGLPADDEDAILGGNLRRLLKISNAAPPSRKEPMFS